MFRILVSLSWLFSFLLSLPQALMFRLIKHPQAEFYQCTSQMIFEMNSDISMVNGRPTFSFWGVEPKILYRVYRFYFLFFVYFFPLFCIIISVIALITVIRRY